jgi:hypothetical protein
MAKSGKRVKGDSNLVYGRLIKRRPAERFQSATDAPDDGFVGRFSVSSPIRGLRRN